MMAGRQADDVEQGIFSFRDLEGEVDAGGRDLDRALGVDGQGFAGLPGETGSVEGFGHFGVLGLARKCPPADQVGREVDDVTPGLEADQDDLLAAADADLKVAVGKQTRP
jgi:hypothetical protein